MTSAVRRLAACIGTLAFAAASHAPAATTKPTPNAPPPASVPAAATKPTPNAPPSLPPSVPAAVTADRAALIPKPEKVEWNTGSMTLTSGFAVYADGTAETQAEARTLADMLRPATGFAVPVKPMSSVPVKGAVWLSLDKKLLPELGQEGYRLAVSPAGATITAAGTAGLFYGGQTLRQLLPPAIFCRSVQTGVKWEMPCCKIEDKPRFAWRGFMLDYSRHWFTLEYSKHLLDALAAHKINIFHMHLTDDEGWRIEIKKYPKLTEIGAWRGTECVLPPMRDPDGTKRYGGFFTQAQIRELVAYAKRLHIEIMPEIDLPGHSLAICTAYPETQPSKLSDEKSVQGHKANAISPAKESNYRMVDDIIGEVAALFPFDYVHIGGDEVNHNLWKDCPQIKALIAKEKLGGLGGAQVYFTKRLETILAKHKKKMIGWNEIKNDKLARTTAIMSWTGTGPGYDAARMGFPVVMAPGGNCYFDMGYPDATDEPPSHWWAGAVGPERCYELDPLKDNGLNEEQGKRIMGVHAALWTEFIAPSWKSKSGWAEFKTNGETIDFKVFPRICALSEVGWTPQAERDIKDFLNRLGPDHLQRLKNSGVNARLPLPTALLSKGLIKIMPPYPGGEVRYTLDGSDPFNSKTAKLWDGTPFKGNPRSLRARSFLDGMPGPLRAGAATEAAGKWDKDSAGSEFAVKEFDLSDMLDEPGVWRLNFARTGGKQQLAVRRVELLVNGQSVAKDEHDGGSGARSSYRLAFTAPVPAGATVTARIEMKIDTLGGKPDSKGDIQLLKSEGLEPAATAASTISSYGDNTPAKMVDYERSSFFWSDRGVRKGDTVTVTFAEPAVLSHVECVTGKLDDQTKDILVNGDLEISADGTSFRKVAEFAYGAAKAEMKKEKVKAVRITVTGDSGKDWVIFQDLILK